MDTNPDALTRQRCLAQAESCRLRAGQANNEAICAEFLIAAEQWERLAETFPREPGD